MKSTSRKSLHDYPPFVKVVEIDWKEFRKQFASDVDERQTFRPDAPPDIVLIDGEEYSKRSVTYRWLPFVLFGAGFIAGVFFTVILYS